MSNILRELFTFITISNIIITLCFVNRFALPKSDTCIMPYKPANIQLKLCNAVKLIPVINAINLSNNEEYKVNGYERGVVFGASSIT
jgi:hypothetical protein